MFWWNVSLPWYSDINITYLTCNDNKANKYKVILKSIGIIRINKSKETRLHLCRYSSGHLIPNSATATDWD